jgi:hypothetical protein
MLYANFNGTNKLTYVRSSISVVSLHSERNLLVTSNLHEYYLCDTTVSGYIADSLPGLLLLPLLLSKYQIISEYNQLLLSPPYRINCNYVSTKRSHKV